MRDAIGKRPDPCNYLMKNRLFGGATATESSLVAIPEHSSSESRQRLWRASWLPLGPPVIIRLAESLQIRSVTP